MEDVNWYALNKAEMRNQERNRARLTLGIGVAIMIIGIILFVLTKSVGWWMCVPSAAAMFVAVYVINLANEWLDEVNAGWIPYSTAESTNRYRPATIARLQPVFEDTLGDRESA